MKIRYLYYFLFLLSAGSVKFKTSVNKSMQVPDSLRYDCLPALGKKK